MVASTRRRIRSTREKDATHANKKSEIDTDPRQPDIDP